jgi:membrane protease subunit (stomatin/prohibitin family)
MRGKFRGLIMTKVKSHLAKAIKDLKINILEIDAYIDELSEQMRGLLNETLMEYGLIIPEFYITNILLPDDDPNYIKLKQQFADRTLLVRQEEVLRAEAEAARGRKVVEAETEAQLKMLSARGEAEALKIQRQAEAEGYRMQAYAEADEMRAKGYTYQQETARQVGLEAMQNGLTGGSAVEGSGGGSGLVGDLASLGVTLGAVGGVVNMTKDALNPLIGTASEIGVGIGGALNGKPENEQALAQQDKTEIRKYSDMWDCPCGEKGLMSLFCPSCGTKKPDKKPNVWNCPNCGKTGLTSAFCPECGQKKPDNPNG